MIDPWMSWYIVRLVVESGPALLISLGLIGLAIWCVRKLWRGGLRGGFVYLFGAPMVGIPATALVVMIILAQPKILARLELARQIDVPPPVESTFPPDYPLQDLLTTINSKRTRAEEVHELLASAKARYDCRARNQRTLQPTDRAEKYLFLTDNYRSTMMIMIINVWYDDDGTVRRAEGIDSGDPVGIDDCELSR